MVESFEKDFRTCASRPVLGAKLLLAGSGEFGEDKEAQLEDKGKSCTSRPSQGNLTFVATTIKESSGSYGLGLKRKLEFLWREKHPSWAVCHGLGLRKQLVLESQRLQNSRILASVILANLKN